MLNITVPEAKTIGSKSKPSSSTIFSLIEESSVLAYNAIKDTKLGKTSASFVLMVHVSIRVQYPGEKTVVY
jgi:hypothetical protein